MNILQLPAHEWRFQFLVIVCSHRFAKRRTSSTKYSYTQTGSRSFFRHPYASITSHNYCNDYDLIPDSTSVCRHDSQTAIYPDEHNTNPTYCYIATLLGFSSATIASHADFILHHNTTMTFGKLQQLLMVLVGAAALIPSPAVVDGFGVSTIHSRVSVIHGRPFATRSPASSGPLLALFTDYDIDGRRVASNDSSINNRHSASDWLYNVMSLPKSSVLRDIRNPVLTIAVWGTLVSILQRFLATRSSSRMLQAMAANMCVGPTPHNFLVSSLGLLLVFRTNSAYQRFYVSVMM
jgi:hypothetical protein